MVYRGLYSYRQRVRDIPLFPNIFFILLQEFWKKSLTRTSSSIAHLHNVARALSSPSRCFYCQQISAKISFVIFDIAVKKQIECGLAWSCWKSTDLGLTYMFLTDLNAEIVACTLLFRKLRHKPNLESTSKYGFSPDLGEKITAFWACACKLSRTLFSLARVQPLRGGKKGEFRDWTIRDSAAVFNWV